MLTIRSAIDLGIRHALRGGRPADELEELRILRMAWTHMLGMHAWGWIRNRTAELDLVAEQDWIDLPDDCAEVVELHRNGLVVSQVCRVTMPWIAEARSKQLGYQVDSFWWASEWYQDTPDTEPRMRLAIYPAQVLSASAACTLVYTGGRLQLRNGPDDPGLVPLPADGSLDMLFIDICRAIAKGYEHDTDASKEQRLAEVAVGPTFLAAKRQDQNRQHKRVLSGMNGWMAGSGDGRPQRLRVHEPIDMGDGA